MHYAAQTGQIRSIPFLIKKGADLSIQDKTGHTAIQLSKSDKVRENILVYSGEKHDISLQDKKYLGKGVIGQKVDISK